MENKTKNKLNGAKVQESAGCIHQRSCATL